MRLGDYMEITIANELWETVIDTLEAFGPLVRLRRSQGWALHSWNLFETITGGGRIAPYPQMMVCTLWTKFESPKQELGGIFSHAIGRG
jgi:hypothetical protein